MEHQKYRILWLTNFPFSSLNGGTERITHIAMEELAKRGHTCRYISIRNGYCFDEDEQEVQLSDFLKENRIGFAINQIGYAENVLKTFLDEGGRRWQSEGGKIISCLHFSTKPYSYSHLYSAAMAVTGIRQKIKNFFLLQREFWRGRFGNRYQGKQFCFRHSDRYVVLAQGYVQELLDQVKSKAIEKMYVIPNVVSFTDQSLGKESEKKEKIVLVVSRLSEFQKRLSLVMRAWRKLTEASDLGKWQLHIVGSGDSESYYKRLARQWKLSHVSFIPFCDPRPHYAKAAVFLMTSYTEGWPLTLGEAMHFGCVPIVMDSVSVFRDILDVRSGIIVEDGNVKALAQSIRYIIDHNEERVKMSHHAIKRSRLFDRSRYYVYWEKLFASISL